MFLSCFEVGDGFDVLVQQHVASPEVPVRPALPRPVAHLLGNRQVLRVVLDGLAEVPLRLIRVAEGAVDKRSIVRHRSPCTAAAAALRDGEAFARVSVCLCVCMCVRARVCMCTGASNTTCFSSFRVKKNK